MPRARPCSSSRAALSPTRRALTTVLRSREFSILLVLVAVVVLATIKNHGFLFSSDGWRNFLLNPSILLLLAVGQAVVIITRNVDLSVGSVLALTAYLTGRLFIDQPGIPIVAVFAACLLLGARPRPRQRRAGRLRQGAGAGHHARHALHLPRHHAHLGRQRPDQRRRPAPRASSQLGTKHGRSRSRCSRSSRSSCSRSSATTSAPPAAAASSTRSAPTPTPRALRPPVRRRILARVRPQRRARRPRRRPLRRPLRHRRAPAPASASSCRPSRPWSIGGVAIFGGSGTVWGAAIGAFLLVTINRALPSLGIEDFWQRAVVGALILGAIVLDRVLAVRQARKLAEARDHVMSTDPAARLRRPAPTPAYSAPLWQRLLLTREIGRHRAHRRGDRLLDRNVAELRRPADPEVPAPGHRADPADRAADDADHHHRRDRPVGRQHHGPEQRAPRRAHDDGMSIPAAALARAARRRWSAARSTASSSRTSGCRRSRSRSARSRSSAASRSACSAPRRSPTSPRSGPTWPPARSASTSIPLVDDPVRGARRRLRRAAALLDLRPRRLRHRPQRRGGALHRRRRRADQVHPLRPVGRGLRLRRHLLHAALRQRPRRQRHRPRAAR